MWFILRTLRPEKAEVTPGRCSWRDENILRFNGEWHAKYSSESIPSRFNWAQVSVVNTPTSEIPVDIPRAEGKAGCVRFECACWLTVVCLIPRELATWPLAAFPFLSLSKSSSLEPYFQRAIHRRLRNTVPRFPLFSSTLFRWPFVRFARDSVLFCCAVNFLPVHPVDVNNISCDYSAHNRHPRRLIHRQERGKEGALSFARLAISFFSSTQLIFRGWNDDKVFSSLSLRPYWCPCG